MNPEGMETNRLAKLAPSGPKPIAREKLTKHFFMLAPAGKFLVSNCGNPAQFQEIIAPLRERQRQWKRITFARANGRLCMVFENAADFQAWFRGVVGGGLGNN